MIRHRSFNDIFPPSYAPSPDLEDIRRTCESRLSDAHQPEMVYNWIEAESEDDAYMQEAYAEMMLLLIQEHMADTWDTTWSSINSYVLEDIRAHLNKIVYRAQTCQVNDLVLSSPVSTTDGPAVITVERFLALEQRVGTLECQHASSLSSSFLWPMYAPDAKEDDKQQFEQHLREICQQRNRTMTHEVKLYLEIKASAGLIVRPSSIIQEYEWVQRFGYCRKPKTYYAS